MFETRARKLGLVVTLAWVFISYFLVAVIAEFMGDIGTGPVIQTWIILGFPPCLLYIAALWIIGPAENKPGNYNLLGIFTTLAVMVLVGVITILIIN